MDVLVTPPFRHHGGHCYQKNLFDLVSVADIAGENRSTLRLFEDEAPLGPPHAAHNEVSRCGGGRYSHWVQGLWFSASDNSDPNTNGRSYRIVVDDTAIEQSQAAGNVDFEVFQTFACMNAYRREPFPLPDAGRQTQILEIGARYLGVATLFAAQGAHVTVIEPEGIHWDDARSPVFYRTLAERAGTYGFPVSDRSVFDAIIESKGKVTPNIEVLQTTAEEIDATEYSERFDLVFSNSVLEHVFDPERAMENLARCSRPWSLARHGVDFRDHKDFSDPLGFLLIDDIEYRRKLVAKDTVRGNRVRPSELEYWFGRMNFSIKERVVREYNTADCIADFLERNRTGGRSRLYRNCRMQDLYENSIAYTLQLIP